MREIKFRAWDKKAKEMFVPRSMSINGDGILCCWKEGQVLLCQEYENQPAEVSHAELMQFTGLKDKNGKEIYEGDTVSFDSTTMTVEWSAKGAQFFLWQKGWSEYHEIKPECEVIGNIHENPELLKRPSE